MPFKKRIKFMHLDQNMPSIIFKLMAKKDVKLLFMYFYIGICKSIPQKMCFINTNIALFGNSTVNIIKLVTSLQLVLQFLR